MSLPKDIIPSISHLKINQEFPKCIQAIVERDQLSHHHNFSKNSWFCFEIQILFKFETPIIKFNVENVWRDEHRTTYYNR